MGSYGDRKYRAAVGGTVGNLFYRIGGGYREGDGYRDNSGYKVKDAQGKFAYKINSGSEIVLNFNSRLSDLKFAGSLTEEQYEAEVLLQKLLAEQPELLAGDQMNTNHPRRWLLRRRPVKW